MIVPMKKVSLIVMGAQKEEALKKLRKLGTVQIEITEGSGDKLVSLREQITLLEGAFFTIGKNKKVTQVEVSTEEALTVATQVSDLSDEMRKCQADRVALVVELERLKTWGEIDLQAINELMAKGIGISVYEMPAGEYNALSEEVKTVRIGTTKSSVRFALVGAQDAELLSSLSQYRFVLPQMSTAQMRQEITRLDARMEAINAQIASFAGYTDS